MAYKNKYAREKQQQSNDGGITWVDVPNTYRRGRLIEEASDDCNTVEWRDVPNSWFCVSDNRLTQWVKDGTECFGNNKYELLKEQESFDGGNTWTETGSTNYGDLIEANSADCGYVEVQERWVEVTGEYVCDGYTKYKKEKKQTSTDGETWVDTTETRTGAFVENNSQYCGYSELTTQWIEDGNYVCDCFDKYAQEKEQVQVNGQWVDNGNTRKGSRVIQQNSEDCGYVQPTPPTPEPEYRMVVVQGEYECVGYDKYTKLKKQVSYDSGETWEDVTPLYTEPGELIQEDSTDCGYVPPTPEPEYRWVNDGYECVGYNKYVKERKQVSYDSGETWSNTTETRLGELIEANSEDCGYAPPTPTPGAGDYLTFIPTEDSTFTFTKNALQYTLDNGATWRTLDANTASPTVTAGNKIMWKQTGLTPSQSSTYGIGTFSSTGRFEVSGNIMSLYYGDNFVGRTDLTGKNYAFYRLFYNRTKLVSAENLVLPATTLVNNCYGYMFEGCTNLTTAPKLPATTLANECYRYMFYGCTSLTTAPVLPATTLADYCYRGMFYGCTSLTTAPALPATTLANYCYASMFDGCSSLTTAPVLPATTLAEWCYRGMFYGCRSLTTAPALPSTTLVEGCYKEMFRGCTSLTTAPALPATTLADDCYGSMFYGCTSLTTAPVLPATTLATSCYQYMFHNCTALTSAPSVLPATTLANGCYFHMFYGCSSLTTAPELPATTLVSTCYSSMFSSCSSLNYIKALFTTKPITGYTQFWVSGVAASGTFVKNSAAQWDVTGMDGVPSGWTVVTE